MVRLCVLLGCLAFAPLTLAGGKERAPQQLRKEPAKRDVRAKLRELPAKLNRGINRVGNWIGVLGLGISLTAAVLPPPKAPSVLLRADSSDAQVIDRLWFDTRIKTRSDPFIFSPHQEGRFTFLTRKVFGYGNREQSIRRLYPGEFSPANAASAEHFYFAAWISDTLPLLGTGVAAGGVIGWDGVVGPARTIITHPFSNRSLQQSWRHIKYDWNQVHVGLAGAYYGATFGLEDPLGGSVENPATGTGSQAAASR